MPSKKSSLVILIVALVCLGGGFFLGMEYKAYQIRSSLQKVFKSDDVSTPQEAEEMRSEKPESKKVIIEKEQGEEVKLATINLTVNSSEEKQVISSSYGKPAAAKESAKFVVVSMSVINTTNQEFDFYPDDDLKLIDNQGRKFETYDDSIGSIDNYLNMRDLSPSIKENGFLVYEIPEDAEGYSLVVEKTEADEVYKVRLK